VIQSQSQHEVSTRHELQKTLLSKNPIYLIYIVVAHLLRAFPPFFTNSTQNNNSNKYNIYMNSKHNTYLLNATSISWGTGFFNSFILNEMSVPFPRR
jgi:hypothetical protein